MNDYGKIITSYSDGKITTLDYYIDGIRYSIFSLGKFQYINIQTRKFEIKYTPYKTIKDNGLKDYILKIINECCTSYQPNIFNNNTYLLPQQPFFDALITKINNDWINK